MASENPQPGSPQPGNTRAGSPRSGNPRAGEQQGRDVRLSAHVFGVVQGVGFRFRTMGKADELALRGEVRNLSDGTVGIVAEGPQSQAEKLLDWLRSDSAPGRVERVEASLTAAEGSFQDFRAR